MISTEGVDLVDRFMISFVRFWNDIRLFDIVLYLVEVESYCFQFKIKSLRSLKNRALGRHVMMSLG